MLLQSASFAFAISQPFNQAGHCDEGNVWNCRHIQFPAISHSITGQAHQNQWYNFPVPKLS